MHKPGRIEVLTMNYKMYSLKAIGMILGYLSK